MKKMVNKTLSKEERIDIKIESKWKFDNSFQNLNSSANKVVVNDWDDNSVAMDEVNESTCSELSQISELENLDCSVFVTSSIESK